MECKYFKCEPKEQAICCLDTTLSLTGKELEEHREVLNKEGLLIAVLGKLTPNKIKVELEKKLKKATGYSLLIWYPLRNLAKYLPEGERRVLKESFKFSLNLDLQYFALTPVKRETAEFLKSFNILNFAKCPYYDEETRKCKIYKNRFLQCKLFPRFNMGTGQENFLLELCKLCNPESCLDKKVKGAKKVEELKREEAKYRQKMEKEFKEFKKRHEKVLANYFSFLGWAIMNAKNPSEYAREILIDFFTPSPNSLKAELFGGRFIKMPPVFPAYLYLLYKELGWSLDESIKALNRFEEYAKENRYNHLIDFVKQVKPIFEEAKEFSFAYIDEETERKKLETGLLVFFSYLESTLLKLKKLNPFD
jgi:Fe-S-cluster containining protein